MICIWVQPASTTIRLHANHESNPRLGLPKCGFTDPRLGPTLFNPTLLGAKHGSDLHLGLPECRSTDPRYGPTLLGGKCQPDPLLGLPKCGSTNPCSDATRVGTDLKQFNLDFCSHYAKFSKIIMTFDVKLRLS